MVSNPKNSTLLVSMCLSPMPYTLHSTLISRLVIFLMISMFNVMNRFSWIIFSPFWRHSLSIFFSSFFLHPPLSLSFFPPWTKAMTMHEASRRNIVNLPMMKTRKPQAPFLQELVSRLEVRKSWYNVYPSKTTVTKIESGTCPTSRIKKSKKGCDNLQTCPLTFTQNSLNVRSIADCSLVCCGSNGSFKFAIFRFKVRQPYILA